MHIRMIAAGAILTLLAVWMSEDAGASVNRTEPTQKREFISQRFGSANLLTNSGFEVGTGGNPIGWGTFTLPGSIGLPVYTWDGSTSQEGNYSVGIEATAQSSGVWQQTVEVSPGTVYTLTGYVSFEGIVPPGYCNMEVIFRDSDNRIIEFVDLAEHDGTRTFELDFPYNLKFRAPDNAATAEVNCFLQGPGKAWFDNIFFAAAEMGNISGVVGCSGQPVEGARVWIWGDPWGKVCEAFTNDSGQYTIEDIPAASPRYVMLASKVGYNTRPAGDIDIIPGETVSVDFRLVKGNDPRDDLRIKYGFLELNYQSMPVGVPTDAVIPSNSDDYPESVHEFLKSDSYITSDDPEIIALANQIINTVPAEDRDNTREVAWAVYEWIVRNINHDAVFDNDTPSCRDVTSGIWQTIEGNGWCWGRNFYDWGFKPQESLAVKCVICVEHSWLSSSLLRALNIPARARVGSAQFWVQKPGEYGYWVGLSTSSGSNSYREHGTLGRGFGGSAFPPYFSVTSEPFLHEDWNMQTKCLWRETHPWGESYPADSQGLEQALADMDEFQSSGEAPDGPGAPPTSDCYQVNYSDITVNLYNIGEQRILDARFPMVSESDTHRDMERQAYWSNHPECITRTWVEEITNPPVEGTQRWFHIEFDLTSLVENPPLVIDSGDYNGDGTSNIAIFRESSGLWAVREITRLYFGRTSDIPVPGDYDGDGITEPAIFRDSSGLWAARELTRFYFGSPSDKPLPVDFDGDGSCDAGIFREDSSLWAVREITRSYFGTAGDNPIPGDYSGDGTKDIAVFRPSSSLWALRNISRVYFGSSGDRGVPADFDGSGTWSPAIFRPASGLWAISGLTRVYFGGSADQPVPGEYSGDGTDNIGIFRDSHGLWAIRGITRVYFGGSSDIPVTR